MLAYPISIDTACTYFGYIQYSLFVIRINRSTLGYRYMTKVVLIDVPNGQKPVNSDDVGPLYIHVDGEQKSTPCRCYFFFTAMAILVEWNTNYHIYHTICPLKGGSPNTWSRHHVFLHPRQSLSYSDYQQGG